jgi:aquaporin Z
LGLSIKGENMSKFIVEVIGTFFLMFTICMVATAPGAGAMAPLAIGSVLMVMIFAGGYISGAHYNPAVTVSVFIRGKLENGLVVPYIIAQLIGAVGAVLLAGIIKPELTVTLSVFPLLPTLIGEFLYTFALCYVVLNVATSKGMASNPTYGLAIGFTVLSGAYAVGSITGGAFNPAVTVGLALLGIFSWHGLWVYLVAQTVAAVAAALIFKTVVKE